MAYRGLKGDSPLIIIHLISMMVANMYVTSFLVYHTKVTVNIGLKELFNSCERLLLGTFNTRRLEY